MSIFLKPIRPPPSEETSEAWGNLESERMHFLQNFTQEGVPVPRPHAKPGELDICEGGLVSPVGRRTAT